MKNKFTLDEKKKSFNYQEYLKNGQELVSTDHKICQNERFISKVRFQ